MDFHSFPWLLKCHRVSWFECKVAQLAPIMLNVKTCEDSLLNQPCDRQQNTHAPLVSRPSTSGPLTTVDPLPDLGKIIAEKMPSNIVPRGHKWAQVVQIFEAIFQIYFTVCYFSQGCFEPIRLNGFVVVAVVDRILAEQCHKPQATDFVRHCYCFCLCVCEVI